MFDFKVVRRVWISVMLLVIAYFAFMPTVPVGTIAYPTAPTATFHPSVITTYFSPATSHGISVITTFYPTITQPPFTTAGPPFDFSILLSPSSLTVMQGAVANYQIFITYSNPAYMGTSISVQVAGLGAGMNYQVTQNPLGLMISTSPSTPTGTYSIVVTGSAMGVVRQTSAVLTVQATQQPFDFLISISPASQNVMPGGSTSFMVTVGLVSGDPSRAMVELSVSGTPRLNMSMGLNPISGTVPFTSTLTVTMGSFVPLSAGNQSTSVIVTVTGRWFIAQTGETRTHAVQATLTVVSPLQPGFGATTTSNPPTGPTSLYCTSSVTTTGSCLITSTSVTRTTRTTVGHIITTTYKTSTTTTAQNASLYRITTTYLTTSTEQTYIGSFSNTTYTLKITSTEVTSSPFLSYYTITYEITTTGPWISLRQPGESGLEVLVIPLATTTYQAMCTLVVPMFCGTVPTQSFGRPPTSPLDRLPDYALPAVVVVAAAAAVAFLFRRGPSFARRGQVPTYGEVQPTTQPGLRFCVNCGTALAPNLQFCTNCGSALGTGASDIGTGARGSGTGGTADDAAGTGGTMDPGPLPDTADDAAGTGGTMDPGPLPDTADDMDDDIKALIQRRRKGKG